MGFQVQGWGLMAGIWGSGMGAQSWDLGFRDGAEGWDLGFRTGLQGCGLGLWAVVWGSRAGVQGSPLTAESPRGPGDQGFIWWAHQDRQTDGLQGPSASAPPTGP